jgi:UDP-N-acetylmuramoylalanine--D-glutamate ligase
MAGKVIILGGGESGVWSAALGMVNGWDVFLSDSGMIKDENKAVLLQYSVRFEEGVHSFDPQELADIVVKSPGISDEAATVQFFTQLNIPVISEIEWAFRFQDKKIVAITGSNGKTTTTKLTWHLLHEAGLNAGLGGNIGKSFAHLLMDEPERDIYVLELSSFQLDGIDTFRANVAILLNITPDHLDRYHYDIMEYAASKGRICLNQTIGDVLIYHAQDELVNMVLADAAPEVRRIPVSFNEFQNESIKLSDGSLLTLETTGLRGRHNAFNAICALEVGRAFNLPLEDLQHSLNSFVNEPHRLEDVGELDGVVYINDSKATNVDAVFYALEAMNKPTVWIVGGQDKGNDYSALDARVREKVKTIVCMGVDNAKLMTHFGEFGIQIFSTSSLDEALQTARQASVSGDAILLSPACASFDLFNNYMHRGDLFREWVLEQKKL